jgi:hypothetical protein
VLNRILICCVVFTLFIGVSHVSWADTGEGEMAAVLIDPMTMVDLDQAKKFCEDEPHAIQCDVLREHLAAEKQEQIQMPPISYDVLSANFE